MISLLVQHIKSRKRASAPYNLDIAQLVALGGQTPLETHDFDPLCFKDYASKNWLFHTRHFRQDNTQSASCWPLWWRLLSGQVQQITLPFQPLKQIPSQGDYWFSEALKWAQANKHTGVLNTVFSECSYTRRNKLCYLIHQYRSRLDSIFDEWLECTINALFSELGSIDSPVFSNQQESIRGRIRFLAALGAAITRTRLSLLPYENCFDSPEMELLLQTLDKSTTLLQFEPGSTSVAAAWEA